MNVSVLGKRLELLSSNGVRFEINQLLFGNDTALVSVSEKLCRVVSEFGRACERRKLRVVGQSKVMRCSRYGNERSNACDTKRRTVRGTGLF